MSRILMILGAATYISIHGTGISLISLLAALVFAFGLILKMRELKEVVR